MKLSKIFVALIVIIVIILIILIVHINPDFDTDDVQSFDDIKSNLKTGDVLITFGNTLKSAAVRWWIKCPASHVGMIVRLPHNVFSSVPLNTTDDLYVLDIGLHSVFSILGDRDVKLRPLRKVLKSKSCIPIYGIVPIDREISISPEDIINYSSYSFDTTFPLTKPQKMTKYKVCSTFVSKIHEDKGINLSVVKDPLGLTPKDYFEHPNAYFFDASEFRT